MTRIFSKTAFTVAWHVVAYAAGFGIADLLYKSFVK